MDEVVELRQKTGHPLQYGLPDVSTGPDRWLSTAHWQVIIEEPVEKAVVQKDRGHLMAVYARVSSSENKKNLDTQAERLIIWCNVQGWSVGKVVKEVGSASNDQRPTFLALLANPQTGRIVVEHTDRASRFGGASIQTWLSM